MISVEEAKILLMENIFSLDPVKIFLGDAVNLILAEDILSPLDLPPFRQSAMDGYAINFHERKMKLNISGEVKAGEKNRFIVPPKGAIRIFTGAPVPQNSDCVVMQENTLVENGYLNILSSNLKRNENIRLVGFHIKKGEIALKKGTKLSPAAIGFLASLGIKKVFVYRRPKISIIVTGDELQEIGKELQPGQIYESNSLTLKAALNNIGIKPVSVLKARDTKKNLSDKIKAGLKKSDVLIITGGISVGEYDLVKGCLFENNVEEIFYKVNQKPGKPIFFGKNSVFGRKKNKFVFALPGNPAATLVCFYEYVLPAIKKIIGFDNCFLPVNNLKILKDFKYSSGRANFLRGKILGNGVVVLDGQESYMMKSFSEADSLIYLPAIKEDSEKKKEIFKMGEFAEVHRILT